MIFGRDLPQAAKGTTSSWKIAPEPVDPSAITATYDADAIAVERRRTMIFGRDLPQPRDKAAFAAFCLAFACFWCWFWVGFQSPTAATHCAQVM